MRLHSFDKKIQQNRESLDQSYKKALGKFGEKGNDNFTSKRHYTSESIYPYGMFSSNRPKKAYPVVPTYNETSKYSKNYSYRNQSSATGTFTFNVKSPERDGSYQNYHRINTNFISNQNSYYNNSPRRQPTRIFTDYETRLDYLTKRNQQESTEKSFQSKLPNNSSYYKYTYSEKSKNSSIFSPTTSPSGKLHYLSLEISQNNKFSPTKPLTNSNEISQFSPKSNNNTISFSTSSKNNEISYKIPSNTTYSQSKSTEPKFQEPPVQPPARSPIKSTIETNRPPTKPVGLTSETKQPETKQKPTTSNQLATTQKLPTTFPSTSTSIKNTPTSSSTPVSPQQKPNNNQNQSLKQNILNDINEIKDQTEFLDQVEKSMENDSNVDDIDLSLSEKDDNNDLNLSQNSLNTNSSPNKSTSLEGQNNFESPSSFKSVNSNDGEYKADVEIEIDISEEGPNFEDVEDDSNFERIDDEVIRLLPNNKLVRVDSNEFPKMLDLICTQDFFIKPKIKFMVDSTIKLADKMTSDVLKNILIPE